MLLNFSVPDFGQESIDFDMNRITNNQLKIVKKDYASWESRSVKQSYSKMIDTDFVYLCLPIQYAIFRGKLRLEPQLIPSHDWPR